MFAFHKASASYQPLIFLRINQCIPVPCALPPRPLRLPWTLMDTWLTQSNRSWTPVGEPRVGSTSFTGRTMVLSTAHRCPVEGRAEQGGPAHLWLIRYQQEDKGAGCWSFPNKFTLLPGFLIQVTSAQKLWITRTKSTFQCPSASSSSSSEPIPSLLRTPFLCSIPTYSCKHKPAPQTLLSPPRLSSSAAP